MQNEKFQAELNSGLELARKHQWLKHGDVESTQAQHKMGQTLKTRQSLTGAGAAGC